MAVDREQGPSIRLRLKDITLDEHGRVVIADKELARRLEAARADDRNEPIYMMADGDFCVKNSDCTPNVPCSSQPSKRTPQ